ncbi:MAG: hypothetical protein KatS3mg090_0679 [Patescibacteria group bacterium]|nr:MAG: hypothetical protein KatS3mg090_0679 [Patescibacteria group bacterium]
MTNNLKLTDIIDTIEQRNIYLSELEELLYNENRITKSELKSKLNLQLYEYVIEKINTDKKPIKDIISTIIDKIKKITIVKITIPFYPTAVFEKKIINLLKSHKKEIIIQINVDKNILAGAIIETKNKLKDYSLNKFLRDNHEI